MPASKRRKRPAANRPTNGRTDRPSETPVEEEATAPAPAAPAAPSFLQRPLVRRILIGAGVVLVLLIAGVAAYLYWIVQRAPLRRLSVK